MHQESSRTHDVFLSYSSKDKNWADAACAVLERHRIRCWIAPRDITPGDEWGAAIVKGIKGSRIMVLIFSGHANASAQVRREVERAISQGMTVLPLRVEDVRPKGAMEYALSNTHWLDAFTPPVERQLEVLARSVKTLLGNRKSLDPAAAPETGRSRSPWLMVLAASLFGIVTLVALIVTLQARNGKSKGEVVDSSSGQAVREGRRAALDRPRVANKRADPPRANPQAPVSPPERIPPAGPARLATVRTVRGPSDWIVEGDQVFQVGQGHGVIWLGDPGWTDYDFTFEACKTESSGGIGLAYRGTTFPDGKAIKGYVLWLAGSVGPNHHLGFWTPTKETVIGRRPGTIQLNQWYRVKVSLRGSRTLIEFDDRLVFDLTDDSSLDGRVALHCFGGVGRFRDIKVAAPDGTMLWEGLPDLPGK